MRIGILGATGLIGNHTARAVLAAGHALTVIHRPSSPLFRIEDLPFEGRLADLNDRDALIRAFRDLDVVINCAGHYPRKPRPMLEEVELARRQMHNFLDACLANHVPKAVYVGSPVTIPRDAADETDYFLHSPPDKTPYIQVKWAMDKIARERAEEENIPLVVAMPTMTMGEYDYVPTTGRFVLAVARRSLPAFVEGKRNVVYAGDVGRGLVLAAEKGKAGARYVLSGTNITMGELVALIAREAAVSPPPYRLSLPMAGHLAFWDKLRYRLFGGGYPMLETAVATLAAGRFFEGEKARRELSYQPTLAPSEIIRKTLAWFRREGLLSKNRGEA